MLNEAILKAYIEYGNKHEKKYITKILLSETLSFRDSSSSCLGPLQSMGTNKAS